MWEFDAQSGIIAPPITYEIDGEQYISVMAGWGGSVGLSFSVVGNSPEEMEIKGRILTFKVGGEAELPAIQMEHRLPEPPELTASSDLVHKGNQLYHNNCVYCHGPGAISTPNLRDLRYMDKETHEQFLAIVYGGIWQDRGMPGYDDLLSVDDVEAIHAYLTKVGHTTLAFEQQSETWKDFKEFNYGVLAHVTKFFTGIFTWVMRAA